VLSPEANRIKPGLSADAGVCEDTNPLEFFRIPWRLKSLFRPCRV